MKNKNPFRLFEIVAVFITVLLFLVLVLVQNGNYQAMLRDNVRKTAINAMYYALMEDYAAQNGHFPEIINAEILPTVAAELWTDPDGVMLGYPEAEYVYVPGDCYQGKCGSFRLIARMEKEDTYTKESW